MLRNEVMALEIIALLDGWSDGDMSAKQMQKLKEIVEDKLSLFVSQREQAARREGFGAGFMSSGEGWNGEYLAEYWSAGAKKTLLDQEFANYEASLGKSK